MVKKGRPTKYTLKLADDICIRLACGESMRSVARDPKMPTMSTLFLWLRKHDGFSEQYAKAKIESADAMYEDAMDIVDNQVGSPVMVDGQPLLDKDNNPILSISPADVSHARLRYDARKWAASKMRPKKYGEQKQDTSPDAESVAKALALLAQGLPN